MTDNKSIYHIEWSKLQALGISNNQQFLDAKPFPHIIIDDLFDHKLIRLAEYHFPKKGAPCWRDRTLDSPEKMSGKLQLKHVSEIEGLHSSLQTLLGSLVSAVFTNFLETLSSTEGLITDPFFSGGGIQMTLPNGELKPHTDFLLNKRSKVFRTLNAILYLNASKGGELCLYESSRIEKIIESRPNRLVIFQTGHHTIHGHKRVLSSSPPRKSLSAFFYINKWYKEQVNITTKAKFIL